MTAPITVTLLSDVLSILAVFAFAVVLVLILVIGTMHRMALLLATFGGVGSGPREEKTNCPRCGARTTVDPGACDYCGESVTDDEPPDYGRADEGGERVDG